MSSTIESENKSCFIGMDLHQKTSTFSVKEKEGRVIEAKTIPTTKEDIEKFLAPYQGSLLTLEPVSQWYCYADFIESLGLTVKIANPMKVKVIASARIKTDSIDAGALADLLRANMLPESYHAPADVRAWKEEVRLRMSLVRLRAQVKNKIHALTWKQGLRSPYALFSKKGLQWLDAQVFSKEITVAIATYRETLALLDRQINDAEKRMIEDNKHREEVKLLITIPGIKYLSALTIMAEIGDITRFPSAKKLMGYAGVVPSTYASGGKVRHGKIIKQGSSWLRYVLIEAAHHQLRCTKTKGLGEYYKSIKERKGGKAAAVATARKLCAVIFRVLTNKQSFVSPEEWENRRAHHRGIAINN
jgi:transposase